MSRACFIPLCLLVGAACAAGPAAPPAATTDAGLAVAVLADHGSVELLPGTVKAATAVTLMARVSGQVGRIAAVPGTRVAAGALLVEIDAGELAARRDQAKALAAQAAADFERATRLLEKAAFTKAEHDAAQARAASTAAAAREAEIMAGYTRITAPFAGVVVRKHVEVGDLLSPGRPVVDLEDPASLRLEVEVPESLAAHFTPGRALRVLAGGLERECPVAEVIPAADPVSRTVLAKIALPADAKDLRSGQFGRAAVPVAGGKMLAVPSAAVVRRGQLDMVFVAGDGRARLRLVRPGGSEGGLTFIRAGLAEGETVVTAGAAALIDGQELGRRP